MINSIEGRSALVRFRVESSGVTALDGRGDATLDVITYNTLGVGGRHWVAWTVEPFPLGGRVPPHLSDSENVDELAAAFQDQGTHDLLVICPTGAKSTGWRTAASTPPFVVFIYLRPAKFAEVHSAMRMGFLEPQAHFEFEVDDLWLIGHTDSHPALPRDRKKWLEARTPLLAAGHVELTVDNENGVTARLARLSRIALVATAIAGLMLAVQCAGLQ